MNARHTLTLISIATLWTALASPADAWFSRHYNRRSNPCASYANSTVQINGQRRHCRTATYHRTKVHPRTGSITVTSYQQQVVRLSHGKFSRVTTQSTRVLQRTASNTYRSSVTVRTVRSTHNRHGRQVHRSNVTTSKPVVTQLSATEVSKLPGVGSSAHRRILNCQQTPVSPR